MGWNNFSGVDQNTYDAANRANQLELQEQQIKNAEAQRAMEEAQNARKERAMGWLFGTPGGKPNGGGGMGMDQTWGSGLYNFSNNFGTGSFSSGLGFARGGLVPPAYLRNGGVVYANEGWNGSPEGSVPMNSNADVPGLMTPSGTDLGGVVPRIGQGLGGLPPDPTSRYSQDLSDPRGLSAPMGTGRFGADGKSGGGGGGGGRRGGGQGGDIHKAAQELASASTPAVHGISDMFSGAMYADNLRKAYSDLAPHFATGGVVGMHPGQPRGTDTVPAWLTPGEAVLTKEATALLGPERIEALNTAARALMGGQMGGMPGADGGAEYRANGGMVGPRYYEGGEKYVPYSWADDPTLYEQLNRAVPQENHGWTEEAIQGYRTPGVAQSFEQPQYSARTPYNVSEAPMTEAQRAQGLVVNKYQPNTGMDASSNFNQFSADADAIKTARRAEGVKAAQAAYDQMSRPVPNEQALVPRKTAANNMVPVGDVTPASGGPEFRTNRGSGPNWTGSAETININGDVPKPNTAMVPSGFSSQRGPTEEIPLNDAPWMDGFKADNRANPWNEAAPVGGVPTPAVGPRMQKFLGNPVTQGVAGVIGGIAGQGVKDTHIAPMAPDALGGAAGYHVLDQALNNPALLQQALFKQFGWKGADNFAHAVQPVTDAIYNLGAHPVDAVKGAWNYITGGQQPQSASSGPLSKGQPAVGDGTKMIDGANMSSIHQMSPVTNDQSMVGALQRSPAASDQQALATPSKPSLPQGYKFDQGKISGDGFSISYTPNKMGDSMGRQVRYDGNGRRYEVSGPGMSQDQADAYNRGAAAGMERVNQGFMEGRYALHKTGSPEYEAERKRAIQASEDFDRNIGWYPGGTMDYGQFKDQIEREKVAAQKEATVAQVEGNNLYRQALLRNKEEDQDWQQTKYLNEQQKQELNAFNTTASKVLQSEYDINFGNKKNMRNDNAGAAAASLLMPQLMGLHQKYYKDVPFGRFTLGAKPGYVDPKTPYLKLADGTFMIAGIDPWQPHSLDGKKWVANTEQGKVAAKIKELWDLGQTDELEKL